MQSSRLFFNLIEHASKQLFIRNRLISNFSTKSAISDILFKESIVTIFHLRNFSTPATKPADASLKGELDSSEKPLDPPAFEEGEKVYPEKLKKLVDEISQLTLLEVAEFNELFKKTLKIADLPVMHAAAAPTAQKEEVEEAAELKQAKSSFTVRILKFEPEKKVALIKEIKSIIPGMNLVQAKKFVESVPSVVGTDIAQDEANKLKETLTGVGAFVEIE